MSRDPDKRNTTEPSHFPFSVSSGEAETWLKRGEALGSLLSRLLRRRTWRSGLGETSVPRRFKSQRR